jgi:hypothetical protein
MSLNPEFQRNLWLQLSPQRLIAAPVVIGLALALALLGDVPRVDIAEAAGWFFYLLVAFWGTRRAADSVAEEVVGGTWDAQRMSALGAWAMSWGKLLGSTIYVWYCAAICLVVYLYGLAPGRPTAGLAADLSAASILVDLAVMVGTGLLGQAVAMAACLAILGRSAQGRRLPVTASQLIGLTVVVLVPFGEYVDPVVAAQMDVTWYGMPAQTPVFALASLAAFLAWALIGVYRLMRIELQFRSYPFVWLLLVLFLMLYAEGFLYDTLRDPDVPVFAWLLVPAMIAAALTYLVLFLQPKDIVRYRWLAASAASGDLRRALALMPLWLPTFAITVALVVALIAVDIGSTYRLPGRIENLPEFADLREGGWAMALAGLLFMARDIALVLYLNFNKRRRRADVAAFIYLVVLYLPLPALAGVLEGDLLLPLFLPTPGASPLMAILPPLIQAAAMLALLGARMAAARPVMAAAARPA